jgi:hypothetical protein
MIIEFRSSNGSAAFKAANGERVSLRSLGCPDWLIKKVVEGRAARNAEHSAAPAVPVVQAEPQADADALRARLNTLSIL